MFSRLVLFIIVILCSVSVPAQGKLILSPDGKLQAVINPIGKKGREFAESRIEIRSLRGRLLRSRSYTSLDGGHGESIDHTAWSSDARFFVFNTSSSGGHQPWHVTTYFYDRSQNKFYRLDDYIGAVTSDFALEGENTISTTRFNFRLNKEKEPVKVRLVKIRSGP